MFLMIKVGHKHSSLLLVGIGMFAATLLLAGCQTVPKEAPPGMTQAEFFQKAQEAADKNEWSTSLFFYRTFEKRFPNDKANIAASDYEIAFIYYKLQDYKVAKTGFERLLAKYSGPDASALPAWPQVLAQEILKEVDVHLGIDPKTDPALKPLPSAANQATPLPTGQAAQ